MLDSSTELAKNTILLFESSPYFAEQISGQPELLEILAEIEEPQHTKSTSPESFLDASALRRYFHSEMFRIQASSICLGVPIFDTLERTSDLADVVIRTAYRLAREQVLETFTGHNSGEPSEDNLMVVALGRLGLREFDLGSDADLNFVLCDEHAGDMPYWTRVAEQMIALLSSYTAQGNVLSVDTRLRPNGREGSLVQTVSAYHDYFSNRAAAWEGISYMKARAVAGNVVSATRFLHELQEVDWKRYGQSGRSRNDLRNMRARLEKEQGHAFPLKAGPGGYYDIDFLLMYLRLRSAGIFYTVLNTPERIDIVSQLGYLDRVDTQFLQEAATLYRAIDHGLRVYSGHAEGNLPNSELHLQALSQLVNRWTPDAVHDEPLPGKLSDIQRRTRELFRRFFP